MTGRAVTFQRNFLKQYLHILCTKYKITLRRIECNAVTLLLLVLESFVIIYIHLPLVIASCEAFYETLESQLLEQQWSTFIDTFLGAVEKREKFISDLK